MKRVEKERDTAMAENRAAREIGQVQERELSARTLRVTPILLTIAVYGGALCIGEWACLNLIHWFWRQL
ncbi:MAG TPA: hypothetical protein VKP58_06735 [Candidatus Acidoferrum sp.]|nr:hypothetical protein [Candidatus Acidoferrum sp.]